MSQPLRYQPLSFCANLLWSDLANMAQGKDWIGIVPRDADSYFASQLFPAVNEVRDILAYPAIAQHANLEQQVQWYPVEPLQKAR